MEIMSGFDLTQSSTCSIEGCDKPIECKGVCNAHYQRFKLYGRYETVVWGQSSHPLYNLWNEKKNANSLCDKWLDFKSFISDVGERPDQNHRLGRRDKKEVYGPNNFYWKQLYLAKDGESKNEALRRRRSENPEIYRANELKRNFNISYEEWTEKLKSQNNVCAICKEPEKAVHHINGK